MQKFNKLKKIINYKKRKLTWTDGGGSSPKLVAIVVLRKAGRGSNPRTNIASFDCPAPGVAGWRRGAVLPLLATGSAIGEWLASLVDLLQWW